MLGKLMLVDKYNHYFRDIDIVGIRYFIKTSDDVKNMYSIQFVGEQEPVADMSLKPCGDLCNGAGLDGNCHRGHRYPTPQQCRKQFWFVVTDDLVPQK